jgi:hypothetical protein
VSVCLDLKGEDRIESQLGERTCPTPVPLFRLMVLHMISINNSILRFGFLNRRLKIKRNNNIIKRAASWRERSSRDQGGALLPPPSSSYVPYRSRRAGTRRRGSVSCHTLRGVKDPLS